MFFRVGRLLYYQQSSDVFLCFYAIFLLLYRKIKIKPYICLQFD